MILLKRKVKKFVMQTQTVKKLLHAQTTVCKKMT